MRTETRCVLLGGGSRVMLAHAPHAGHARSSRATGARVMLAHAPHLGHAWSSRAAGAARWHSAP